jgi:predicted phage gp36 major capsid-like protein
MPYNSLTSRTDASSLIPQDVQREILSDVAATNPLLQLARRLPDMSRAQRRLPVLSALATAYFVNGDTGLKQTTEVAWSDKYIDAEELAVIVPVPQAVLDDVDYDLWAEIRPEIVNAINYTMIRAVLFGTNIPSSWTTNMGAAGLLAAIVAASHAVDLSTQEGSGLDMYDVLLGDAGVISLVEQDGYMVNGHIAALSMRGKLRGVRAKVDDNGTPANLGMPIFSTNMQSAQSYNLDGDPIYFPTDGSIDATSALLFSGDWTKLVWSMRQDMTFTIATEASIQDAGGNVMYNLFQQDMVALRAVMRIGFALPNPINRVNTSSSTRLAFAALVP